MFGGGMTKLVSVLTNPSLPQCQKLLVPYPREDDLALSVIGKRSDHLGSQREPPPALDKLEFAISLHKQIPARRGHFVEAVHVNQTGSNIKKERLVIGVHRVKRLPIRDEPIDLRR